MTKTSLNKQKGLRRERNADVIRRMKGGDQLSSFNSYSSWFPPRPIIEKDAKAVEDLYGTSPRKLQHVPAPAENTEVAEKPERRLNAVS